MKVKFYIHRVIFSLRRRSSHRLISHLFQSTCHPCTGTMTTASDCIPYPIWSSSATNTNPLPSLIANRSSPIRFVLSEPFPYCVALYFGLFIGLFCSRQLFIPSLPSGESTSGRQRCSRRVTTDYSSLLIHALMPFYRVLYCLMLQFE